MDLEQWVPAPRWETPCGFGFGLAACPSLGLLVTSDVTVNALIVWSLPGRCGGGNKNAGADKDTGLDRVGDMGGEGSLAPMQFKFLGPDGFPSGYLAFAPLLHLPHLLLVTDGGHDAVHMIDVANKTHEGFLAAPGTITRPRGVAVSTGLAAVSAWKNVVSGDHVVHIYRVDSASCWTHVRVIGNGFGGALGQFRRPSGLRFSANGSSICVADSRNNRVGMIRVCDGECVRHVATELSYPHDVQEVEGGWVVACFGTDTVEFVSEGGDGGGRPSLGKAGGSGNGEFHSPIALAFVPGLGLVVREYWSARMRVFCTPDFAAMWSMSDVRVGWMGATYRAAIRRQLRLGAKKRLCSVTIERG